MLTLWYIQREYRELPYLQKVKQGGRAAVHAAQGVVSMIIPP